MEQVFPRVVVFEGVDGTGKTTLTRALAQYYRTYLASARVLAASFPGAETGTLGEWVYRLHHHRAPEGPDPRTISPAALQLLHVAAHVDAIQRQFTPLLQEPQGYLLLDRYWWSTYAYARLHLDPARAWGLVHPEHQFWQELPAPQIVYLRRQRSLKQNEINQDTYRRIDQQYGEVIAKQREQGVAIHEIENNGLIEDTWAAVLTALVLPLHPLQEER
jgi:thymidylate kinase